MASACDAYAKKLRNSQNGSLSILVLLAWNVIVRLSWYPTYFYNSSNASETNFRLDAINATSPANTAKSAELESSYESS